MERICMKPDTQNTGNAGEYYIAFILSANGFTTTITLGRTAKYDIIAINPNDRTVKVQVKTAWAKANQWPMHKKDETLYATDLFYAFVRLNEMKEPPEYWIIPSTIVSKVIRDRHEIWLKTPGRKGQPHKDTDLRRFITKNDQYNPSYWNEEESTQYYMNVGLLLTP